MKSLGKILFFIFLISLSSCSKNEVTIAPKGEYINPQKINGEMHNKILAEVLTEWGHNKRTPNPSSKDLVMAFKSANEKLGGGPTRGGENPSDSISVAFVDLIMKTPDVIKMSDFLCENGLISEVVKGKYREFTALLLDPNDNDKSFENGYKKIVAFEWEVVNDKSLIENDRISLLKLTATAKESLKFWFQYKEQDSSVDPQRAIIDVLIIAAADVSCIAVPWFAALASGAFYVAVGLSK